MSIDKYRKARNELTFRDEDSDDEIIIDDSEDEEVQGLRNEIV